MRQGRPQPVLLITAVLLACAGAEGSEEGEAQVGSEDEGTLEYGWTPLFDGTSFAGWRGVDREEIPEGHWTIENGVVRKIASVDVPTAADGQPLVGGDIMTRATFRNFELAFEWKVAPGANSGIKYNVSQEMSAAHEPRTAALGFEYQVLDDDLHPDARNGPNRQAAALYDLMGPGEGKSLRPVGEFNEGRVLFDEGRGEHWLNGVRVLSYDLASDEFSQLFAKSKYVAIEEFSEVRAGHIVLQDHGDDVWYRNVRIREIRP